ncbi:MULTISPECIES: hypothetical protein [Spirulina sp. CCY15215]|uniref:hypothetical protein n=1 Tax=Spirulina sp. CCY15215 TaxID=2767591 RepID=UPI00194E79FF|nr:hypothetical protein [Spirulina major]
MTLLFLDYKLCCAIALDLLLEAIGLQPEDTLITLGDYIDRGNDSKGILDRVIALHLFIAG